MDLGDSELIWGLRLGIGIGHWDSGYGLDMGFVDYDWGFGIGIGLRFGSGIGDWEFGDSTPFVHSDTYS